MSKFNPILGKSEQVALLLARDRGHLSCTLSLDLHYSAPRPATLTPKHWILDNIPYPYLEEAKENSLYAWSSEDSGFIEVLRFSEERGLVKLVSSAQGPPSFQWNGIQMLPLREGNPYHDAQQKVKLVAPQGKRVLDTCGGLGYFSAQALLQNAHEVYSFEINPDVLWLRQWNPWSPPPHTPSLHLTLGDIQTNLSSFPDHFFGAILHDPPRFSIAGDLYSTPFYKELYRLLQPQGILFHYTGTPYKISHGRDFKKEIQKRLELCGFALKFYPDGCCATKTKSTARKKKEED
jgi:predicted methyltransferase